MANRTYLISILALFSTSGIHAQQVPIYQVTVTQRTVESVNYHYRNGPTRIDFRGTVLLPDAKGEAVVESKAGRTDVQVSFDHLAAPTRFGTEYLTYVLWAISPEGYPKNMGEVLADGGDHATLRVTSDLQAFGMIVTAEPYSAVRQPSDVVVMQNEIRPDTLGSIEPIRAKYELLPRGSYTYEKSAGLRPPRGPKVSMAEYESLLELYQAQNAVQIAKSQGADRYAADTLATAESLLRDARGMQARKDTRKASVSLARQAAQTAEDARTIAFRHEQEAELAAAHDAARAAEARRAAAEKAAQQAAIQASADRARLEQERAERNAAAAAPPPHPVPTPEPPAEPVVVIHRPDHAGQKELRISLSRELSAILPTRDTPRGLVVVLGDGDFRSADLDAETTARVARIGTVLADQRGLAVHVEGHMDEPGVSAEDLSYRRAAVVRAALLRGGLDADSVTAEGLGNTRLVTSNASPGGREQNRRVEITISGQPIGTLAAWDRTYSLK